MRIQNTRCFCILGKYWRDCLSQKQLLFGETGQHPKWEYLNSISKGHWFFESQLNMNSLESTKRPPIRPNMKERMMRAVGNHPSVTLASGSPDGAWVWRLKDVGHTITFPNVCWFSEMSCQCDPAHFLSAFSWVKGQRLRIAAYQKLMFKNKRWATELNKHLINPPLSILF